MATSIFATGVETDVAYRIAADIERELREDQQHKVKADQLVARHRTNRPESRTQNADDRGDRDRGVQAVSRTWDTSGATAVWKGIVPGLLVTPRRRLLRGRVLRLRRRRGSRRPRRLATSGSSGGRCRGGCRGRLIALGAADDLAAFAGAVVAAVVGQRRDRGDRSLRVHSATLPGMASTPQARPLPPCSAGRRRGRRTPIGPRSAACSAGRSARRAIRKTPWPAPTRRGRPAGPAGSAACRGSSGPCLRGRGSGCRAPGRTG